MLIQDTGSETREHELLKLYASHIHTEKCINMPVPLLLAVVLKTGLQLCFLHKVVSEKEQKRQQQLLFSAGPGKQIHINYRETVILIQGK